VRGAGKTCISLAIATELNALFADGIWFVDLARVSDPGLIPATVGALFNLEIPPGQHGVRLLVRTLAAKSALLILDNCEHLIEAAAELAAALIGGCGYVRILATSREPLGISGECVYKLPLLSVPPSNLRLDAARAASYDAVALFVARARAVRDVFRLTDDNAARLPPSAGSLMASRWQSSWRRRV
jgi:predicted ATPase